jgi:hypothetical protein
MGTSNPHFPGRRAWLALAALALGMATGYGQAQDAIALAQRYPAGAIVSSEQAEKALDEVVQERGRVAAKFLREEQACYAKFFATSCREKAKEVQRLAENRLRAIEVEAKAYQRRERAQERDRVLAEQRAQEEAEAPARLERQQEREATAAKRAAEREHRAQQDKLDQAGAAERAQRNEQARLEKERSVRERQGRPIAGDQAGTADSRVQKHEEKLQEAQAREGREASRRAENVAAFEKKQEAAAERQRKLEERRAKKESERAAKESGRAVSP